MKLILSLSSMIAATSAFAPSSFKQPRSVSVPTELYGEYGASSTSFYTTTEKKDSYASLDDILSEKCKDEKVRRVIVDMLDVCADITEALRTALVTVEDTSNEFGDTQLSVDVSDFCGLNKLTLTRFYRLTYAYAIAYTVDFALCIVLHNKNNFES